MAMSDIGVMLGNMVLNGVNHFTSIPVETQEKILMQIMEENKDTEYGKTLDHSMHIDKKFSVVIVFS